MNNSPKQGVSTRDDVAKLVYALLTDDLEANLSPKSCPDDPVKDKGGDREFPDNATMWSLHLKEETDRAKAQAELWKAALESLIFFAGLFAGVVSAFVIESRKQLRKEDQELLIQSIYNEQRGKPPPSMDYHPTSDQLWINGLWFASLLMTLFSAILGVLAKSWLAKYTPLGVSSGATSEDVYQRWIIEKEAARWKVERVFTSIPLLVQVAFFLFAAGLTIQCLNDHATLGKVVFGIVAAGTGLYLFLSSVPLFSPEKSRPFQTPLSEILIQLRNFVGRLLPDPAVLLATSNKDDVLTYIWCEKLIKSPKPEHVDEAVAEVARNKLQRDCLEALVESGIVEISLKRLKSFMASDYHQNLTPKAHEIMSNHLLSLACFVKYWPDAYPWSQTLDCDFRSSINPNSPFSTWNFFAEPVRPLAFTVRVPILLELGEDVTEREVVEQPWEQLAQSLQRRPKHRLQFILTSCRALVYGKEYLRRVGSRCIASCMGLALKANAKSAWTGVSDGDKTAALDLVKSCIVHVCNEIASGWKKDSDSGGYWKTYSSIGAVSELDNETQTSGFPRTLVAAFNHRKTKYRKQAALIILSLARCDHFLPMYYPNLINAAISDEDRDVREAAASALCKLGSQPNCVNALRDALSKISTQSIRNGEYILELSASMVDYDGLLKNDDLKQSLVINLVAIVFNKPEFILQRSYLHLLNRVFRADTLQEPFEGLIRDQMLLALKQDSSASETAFTVVNQLWTQCLASPPSFLSDKLCQRIILPLMDSLVACVILHPDPRVRLAGRATIALVLETETINELYKSFLKEFAKGAKSGISSGDWTIRRDTVELLSKHLSKPQLGGLIVESLPSVSRLVLYDDHQDVQSAAISFLEAVVTQDKHTVTVSGLIFPVLERSTALKRDIEKRFAPLIAKLLAKDAKDKPNPTEDQARACNYLLDVTIHPRHKDGYGTGLAAILDLSNLIGDRVLDGIKARARFKLKVEGELKGEDLEARSVEYSTGSEELHCIMVLIDLMQNDGLRNTCFGILQSCFNVGLVSNDEHHTQETRSEAQKSTATSPTAEKVCRFLISLAKTQGHEELVRTKAVKALSEMTRGRDSVIAWKHFQELGNEFLNEGSEECMGQCYLNLLATVPAQHDFSAVMPKLVALLGSAMYFWQNLDAWQALACRAEVAQGLIESFEPEVEKVSSRPLLIRVKYAKFVGTLLKTGDFAKGLSHLVALSIQDQDTNVRQNCLEILAELLHSGKYHLGPIERDDLLKGNSDNSAIDMAYERKAWANTLSALVANASELDSLHQRLVVLAVEDASDLVRKAAYDGLDQACKYSDGKLRDQVVDTIVTRFDKILTMGNMEEFGQAIVRLRSDCLEKPVPFKFGSVLQLLSSTLLKTALEDRNPHLRKAAQEFVFALIDHQSLNSKGELRKAESSPQSNDYAAEINSSTYALLEEMTIFIPTFSGRSREKVVVLGIINAMPRGISEDVVARFIDSVVKLLKRRHTSTLWMALEASEALFQKGLGKDSMQSSIMDFLNIAVEDNREDLRMMALKLILGLCKDVTSFFEIKEAHPQLFPLLENPNLRSSVIDLLSLLCTDETVRKSIAEWMMSRIALGSDMEVEGTMALLSGLIVEKRVPTDQQKSDILFFFMPAFLPKGNPQIEQVRSRIIALLWCNYQEFALGDDAQIPELLIDALVTSIFGHHVADHELKMWKELRLR